MRLPLLLILLLTPLPGFSASITTLQAVTTTGTLSLTSDAILLTPPSGTAVRIKPADVLHAVFGPPIQPLARGITLTSGETFAVEAALRVDDAGVHIIRAGAPVVVPLDHAARLLFRPISSSFAARIPAGQSGVLLDTGDFFQGDIRDIDPARVRVDSVLFGTRSFDRVKQVLAVVYHDINPPLARWTVRQTDGSVLMTDELHSSEGALNFTDAELGAIVVRAETISEIQAGGSLLTSLSDRPPDHTDANAILPNATTAGVPMTLVGYPMHSGLGQRPGTSISWNINGTYQSFIAHVGVPATLLPITRLHLSVLIDGREIFKSPPLSSVDDAVPVAVDLTNAKTLTLQVDGDPNAPGAAALWADPVCVNR